MASRYQIWMDGAPVDDGFYDLLDLLEVEENADGPASLVMRLPIARSEAGDLTQINDATLQPLRAIAVTVAPDDAAVAGCIFDGLVLGHKLHMESGLRDSTVEIHAQDRSWLMSIKERTREWPNLTDGLIAATIFSEHEIVPAPGNSADDSGVYSEDGHTLMQRGTDLDFLRQLARRGGRHLRVAGGLFPGAPIGVFARPDTSAAAALKFRLNDVEAPNAGPIDIEWDVMRPSAVVARQGLFTDPSEAGASGDTSDSGLSPLDERDLSTFAGEPMSVILTAIVDDADQLQRRAQALLGEAQWFVRCTTEIDLAVVRALVRAGDIVSLDTIGSVHSGKYLVWSVRHSISPDSHKMNLTLVRNAVGPLPAGGAGGLPGGLL